MQIDIHTHVFHPKIADKVLAQLEDHYSISPVGSGVSEDLQTRLDSAGIEKAVVLTAATSPAQVVPANNWAIEIKKNTERFVPFGTIHPDFDKMESELNRLEENGIKGLKFHPDFQGFRMDDAALYNVMEMIGDRFICLFHVGDVLPPDENPSCPRKLAALRKAFPKPPMIAAHMGGYRQWEYALEHLSGLDVFVDTSSVMDFVDDDLLKTMFDAFGTEHILFGSDYPLFDPAEEKKRLIERLQISEGEFDGIMKNAEVLLFG